MDGQADGWMERVDRWMGRWMGGWNGWIGGWAGVMFLFSPMPWVTRRRHVAAGDADWLAAGRIEAKNNACESHHDVLY